MTFESVSFRASFFPFTFSKIFSETAWPIRAKFYITCLLERKKSGYMTKMAAMPIHVCGKNPNTIFFSRTDGPISTKLGINHR